MMTTSYATLEATTASSTHEITPYQAISLLLNGALERIDQASSKISEGEIDQATVLIEKIIGIVAGLRDSLDFSQGGEIATNLDTLYNYIMGRLKAIEHEKPLLVLEEVKDLLSQVQDGWMGIANQD